MNTEEKGDSQYKTQNHDHDNDSRERPKSGEEILLRGINDDKKMWAYCFQIEKTMREKDMFLYGGPGR